MKPRPTILINGKHYVAPLDKNVKPIKIDGKTFVPLKPAPISADTSKSVKPVVDGKINTFVVANKTYVPLHVIPKVHHATFIHKKNVTKKTTAPVTVVIKVNGEHLVPINDRKVTPIIKNDITYVPTKLAPNHVEVLRPITPTKDGLINTFTLNNRTYIPTNIIPKAYTPIFNNKKVPVNETTLKNTVIKVNDKFYSPVVDKEWKTLTVG